MMPQNWFYPETDGLPPEFDDVVILFLDDGEPFRELGFVDRAGNWYLTGSVEPVKPIAWYPMPPIQKWLNQRN